MVGKSQKKEMNHDLSKIILLLFKLMNDFPFECSVIDKENS